MGGYYGLINTTKNERVSSYWKDYHFCDLYSVMHRYGWQKNDKIISAAYCGCYIWNGEEFVDRDDQEEQEEPEQLEDKAKEEELQDTVEIPETKLGFPQLTEEEYVDHIPDWDEKMICKCCGRGFYEKIKEEDKKSFDSVFHMN